ncbi:hypothetical protein BDZ45DRAFT_773106 [Acephala macrosclerotiorum]|nr:hypothetical protein BDZ45DRAFT_773106 [Acephala macrosclerotiorum]
MPKPIIFLTMPSIIHRSVPRARGNKGMETIYRVEQSFSYDAISESDYLVRANEDATRISDFRIIRGAGNACTVTKRNLADHQTTVTFDVREKQSVFMLTRKSPLGSTEGTQYFVSKTSFGFNVSKIVENCGELEKMIEVAADQECLDAFDVGILMCELDVEDEWDSLPTSPLRSTVPSAGTLPADMEAAIAARRRVNARRMLF